MNNSKIEWCSMTWNPVTGCLHGCTYCYAKRIANRFDGKGDEGHNHDCTQPADSRLREKRYKRGGKPFRYGFTPTFHPYRLREPECMKTPQRIFVCSMADLFGEWVPDEWIDEVFKAVAKAPQHSYYFLTKNPARYLELYKNKALPFKDNYFFGTTCTTPDDTFTWFRDTPCKGFVSIEPLMASFEQPGKPVKKVDWVIIGAETGNRKGKIIPEREWIESIISDCRATNTPIFMKNSLANIWGEPLIQEWPEGLK